MVYVPQGVFEAGNPDSIFQAFRLKTINRVNALADVEEMEANKAAGHFPSFQF